MPEKIIWSESALKDYDVIHAYLLSNWDSKVVVAFIELTVKC
jgi:plasmid stabilization system protein ParE